MSVNDLTIRMAVVCGLAVLALTLAGWRKAARAQPRRPPAPPIERGGALPPERVPYEVTETVATPYHPAGPLRRVWAVVASSGLAVVIGAVIATITGFAVAWVVTTLTDLLKQ